mgnify:CR=1 FL=1
MNENDVLDVAVIGAGPAGLTAGLYAARAGLSVAIVALAVFGANGFMLPALLITSAILVFAGQKEGSQ